MVKSKSRLEKVPEELLKVIQEAMRVRVMNRLEPVGRKWQNYPRYFRAISRHNILKEDLKKSEFKEDD